MTDKDISSIVGTTLTLTGMVVGAKLIQDVAGYKRRKKGGKRKTVKVRAYKRKRKKRKRKRKQKKKKNQRR